MTNERIEVHVSLWSYWLSLLAAVLVGFVLGSCGDILNQRVWDLFHPDGGPTMVNNGPVFR